MKYQFTLKDAENKRHMCSADASEMLDLFGNDTRLFQLFLHGYAVTVPGGLVLRLILKFED